MVKDLDIASKLTLNQIWVLSKSLKRFNLSIN